MSNIDHFVAVDAPKSKNPYVCIVAHENQEKSDGVVGKVPLKIQDWLKLARRRPHPARSKSSHCLSNSPTSRASGTLSTFCILRHFTNQFSDLTRSSD